MFFSKKKILIFVKSFNDYHKVETLKIFSFEVLIKKST